MSGIKATPDQLTTIIGPLASHKMAEAIIKAGLVRRMWHPDLERTLHAISERGSEPALFADAVVPNGWPYRGNLFVTDDNGLRWRISQDPKAESFRLKYQTTNQSAPRKKLRLA